MCHLTTAPWYNIPVDGHIWWLVTSPFLKSSTVESILTKGVLAKYRYFLWNWTPSHIQRIYKGHNSENPLRAITFDWSVLRTWGQHVWATFFMIFSGIPHLPTFCHVACVTYVTSRLSRASRISRFKCRVMTNGHWPTIRETCGNYASEQLKEWVNRADRAVGACAVGCILCTQLWVGCPRRLRALWVGCLGRLSCELDVLRDSAVS